MDEKEEEDKAAAAAAVETHQQTPESGAVGLLLEGDNYTDDDYNGLEELVSQLDHQIEALTRTMTEWNTNILPEQVRLATLWEEQAKVLRQQTVAQTSAEEDEEEKMHTTATRHNNDDDDDITNNTKRGIERLQLEQSTQTAAATAAGEDYPENDTILFL